jgi:DnaK suppressor protein
MDPSAMEGFKRQLETMLSKTRRPLSENEEIAVENSPDMADRSQRLSDSALAIHQIESHFNRTQEIRLALQRIADGSYGSCLRCDSDISPKRLQAVPWTPFCIRCQEIADREKMQPEKENLQVLLRMRDVA